MHVINRFGKKYPISFTLQRLFLFRKDVFTLVCTDLSQLKRLTMLEDINHYRNSMVHSISHELKTPLNGIVNLVQSM